MKKMTSLWGTMTLLALVYTGGCAALFVHQRALLYFPQPLVETPANADNMLFRSDGAQINITTRPSTGKSAVIYFGGNAENVSFALPNLLKAYPHHAIYLVHYRGFGGSTGEPSEAALVADAFAIFDDLKQKHSDITVIGRSLGSGIAIQVASQRAIEQLILITPYDSIENIAAQQFPWAPVRWLLKDKYLSWQYAARIQAPTYVIAAEDDRVVPRKNTDALLAHFAHSLVTLTVLPDTNHHNITNHANYPPMLRGRYAKQIP